MKVVNSKLSLGKANKIFKEISRTYFEMGDPTYLHYMCNPLKKIVFQNIIGTLFYRYSLSTVKIVDEEQSIAYCFHRKIGERIVICMDIYLTPESRGKGLSRKVIELYRKELYKQGFDFILGATFNKNIPSQKMLQKYADANFFYINAFKFNRSTFSSSISLEFKKINMNQKELCFNIIYKNLQKDFENIPLEKSTIHDVIRFIWGPFVFGIFSSNQLIGNITYEILVGTIYIKLALEDKYWNIAPEIVEKFCSYCSLEPEIVVVQHPNNVTIDRNDVEKTSPVLFFNIFTTLGECQ
ncbi:hypothetical protein P4S75_13545 [Anoxybacillus ayderensis]|uniref:hypothetical protein n=1 Tax=Anoxybacillus ayderensis TaxID=265546 RepID=UPI002E1FDAE7|nr:hypothetical protein [Anoxybacillus ayderensis]